MYGKLMNQSMRQYQHRVREQQLAAMRAIKSNDHFSPSNQSNGSVQPPTLPEAPREEVDHDSAAFGQQIQAATPSSTQLNLSQAMQRGQNKPGQPGSGQGPQSMPTPASPSITATPRPSSRQRPLGNSMQERKQDDTNVSGWYMNLAE